MAEDGQRRAPPAGRRTRVAIVGSGFAGVGMAIALKQRGIDFVVLERDDDLGGTWRDNTYPGCQCDVPSHLYSFSFALNPEWSRTYSMQPEIWQYLRRCAEEYGILPEVRFGTAVERAEWDGVRRRWRIDTNRGTWEADVLISGHGALAEPSIPDLSGLETFEGTTFHSARWDHGHDLRGRNVAVVGTGASAIQFIPRIQPLVEQLHVFQRTPAWVLPHTDRPITELERALYRRYPTLQRFVRGAIYWSREGLVFPLARDPRLTAPLRRLGLAHLHRQVKDPELRRKLTPTFLPGCKRLLLSNDYYPSLTKPNVEVVTDPVREVTPTGIVTADGAAREVDTIILGTGFRVTTNPFTEVVHGRGGVSLADRWKEHGLEAYLGTTVPGFPNLFLLSGPNTGIGHTSLLVMIEAQIRYIVDCLRLMDDAGVGMVEVREEANAGFNRWLHRKLAGTVWNAGGCASWYLDAEGRNPTIWPDFTWRYERRLGRFDPAAYALQPAEGASEPATPEWEPAARSAGSPPAARLRIRP